MWPWLQLCCNCVGCQNIFLEDDENDESEEESNSESESCDEEDEILITEIISDVNEHFTVLAT